MCGNRAVLSRPRIRGTAQRYYRGTCSAVQNTMDHSMNLPIEKLPIDTLFSLIDFFGVFVGALGGALAAVRDTRYKYDLVGVTGLALASALGGGIMRDLILQKGPPLAFADARYLMVALAGAVIGMVFAQRIGKNTERALIFMDAAALGLFAVAE